MGAANGMLKTRSFEVWFTHTNTYLFILLDVVIFYYVHLSLKIGSGWPRVLHNIFSIDQIVAVRALVARL